MKKPLIVLVLFSIFFLPPSQSSATQYATEDCECAPWASCSTMTHDSPNTISSTYANQGTYSLKLHSYEGVTPARDSGWYNRWQAEPCYVRFYFYVPTTFQAYANRANTLKFCVVRKVGLSVDDSDLMLTEESGNKFGLWWAEIEGDWVSATTTGTKGEWHYCEIMVDATNNRTRIWYDNNDRPVVDQYDKYDRPYTDIVRWNVNWSGGSGGSPQDQQIYIDDVVVSDQRVGPIPEGEEDATAPFVSSTSPTSDAADVPVNTNISLHIQDSGDGVDGNSVQLTVNGQQIAQSDLQITGDSSDYVVVYDPQTDFDYDSVTTVSVDGQDLHDPPNVMNTYTYTFTTTQAEEPSTYTAVFGEATGCDHTGTIQDAFININSTKYEGDASLRTYTWPQDKVANAIIMKWDLLAIPRSATIQDATLYLYLSGLEVGGGDELYDLSAHKIINYNPVISACTGYTCDGTNSWTPYSGLYNDIPMAQADIAPAEDTKSIDKVYGYKTWTVTKMVQHWVSSPASNYGMLVNSDPVASSDSNRYFNSTESPNPDQRPKLVVTYTEGPAPPSPPKGVKETLH